MKKTIYLLFVILFLVNVLYSQQPEGKISLYRSEWHVYNYKSEVIKSFDVSSPNNKSGDSSYYLVYFSYKADKEVIMHGNFYGELYQEVIDLWGKKVLELKESKNNDNIGTKGFFDYFIIPIGKNYKIKIFSSTIELNSTSFFDIVKK